MNARRTEPGFIAPQFLAALLAVAMLCATIGSMLVSVAKAGSATSQQTLTGILLSQAARALGAEARDSDSDGYPEATAGVVANGDGWNVPAASGAPKSDAWGRALKYCAWDHGTANNSTGRLAGDKPGTQGSILLAVISAGADGVFDTTCDQAKTGVASGDDALRTITVAEAIGGVGGTIFFGDPVANQAALAALNATALTVGEARLVIETGTIKYWSGSGWSDRQ